MKKISRNSCSSIAVVRLRSLLYPDYKPRRIPSQARVECIKKIWEVDPLECPKCHGDMKNFL